VNTQWLVQWEQLVEDSSTERPAHDADIPERKTKIIDVRVEAGIGNDQIFEQ